MKRFVLLVVLMLFSSSAFAGDWTSFTSADAASKSKRPGIAVRVPAPRLRATTAIGIATMTTTMMTIAIAMIAGPTRQRGPCHPHLWHFPAAGCRRRTTARRVQAGRRHYANRSCTAAGKIGRSARAATAARAAAAGCEAGRACARSLPQTTRVSNNTEDDADTPLGDWRTEGKGLVRIAKCGKALCGYVLSSSSNDQGEVVLVNMKPKSDGQWTGNVYSQASGDTYYGTMDMKGANTLRVEACALGRFYCSGNNWSRINAKTESLMSSRPTPAEPRS